MSKSNSNSGSIVKKFGFAPEATMRKTSYYGKPYDETKVGVNFERKNKIPRKSNFKRTFTVYVYHLFTRIIEPIIMDYDEDITGEELINYLTTYTPLNTEINGMFVNNEYNISLVCNGRTIMNQNSTFEDLGILAGAAITANITGEELPDNSDEDTVILYSQPDTETDVDTDAGGSRKRRKTSKKRKTNKRKTNKRKSGKRKTIKRRK